MLGIVLARTGGGPGPVAGMDRTAGLTLSHCDYDFSSDTSMTTPHVAGDTGVPLACAGDGDSCFRLATTRALLHCRFWITKATGGITIGAE